MQQTIPFRAMAEKSSCMGTLGARFGQSSCKPRKQETSMTLRNLSRTASILAAAGLAAAALPAFADASSAHASASSSANGKSSRFSETVGVATPQKRIVGSTHGSGAEGNASVDGRLLNEVVAALVRDPAMQGANIEVRVDDGTVTLDGKAKDSAQADHAKRVAEGLAGQGKVTSSLSTSG
jgi:hypothetical protein